MEITDDEPSLAELRSFFGTCSFPKTVQLGPGELIVDVPHFVERNLIVLSNDPPAAVRIPHLERLIALYRILSASGKAG
ncbi:DUF6965 family protein [Flavitalea flava]